jgi:two-component system cell cycle response regulator
MGQSGRRIVVIEDNLDIANLLQSLLHSAGHHVVSINESKGAVELVRREEPDLVLCDIAMPEVDGYGVLKALQADPETARYPVVFLTAHREFSERVRAFKMGVVDYVTKPFTRETLLRKVDRILRGLERRGDAEPQEAGPGGVPRAATAAGAGAVADDPRDPEQLPESAGNLPPFGALPEMLRTVLIADDNTVFRSFVQNLLSQHGFTVHTASDGETALALALDKRPWLILSDVSMPVVDGFELCRRVRATTLIRHTPFVFLSGWDDYRDRQRALQIGADEFLSKQTPVRELLIRIHLLLQRYSDAGSSSRKPAMEGSIEVVGAAGVLQMWHQGRLSGVCTVRSGTQVFEARFRDGEIVYAEQGDASGAAAVYSFLGWSHGVFHFVPERVESGEPIGASFDQLLLEGCRLLDEKRRTAEPEPKGATSG